MRKLIALLTIFSLNSYGAAPTGVGGEEGQLSYTNNLKAPAYTITSLGGVNSRIETGNTNLLANPSFEHPTVGTGWTATNATPSAETSIVVEGKKSLKLVLTGALTAYQDSTINAAQLVGLQGVAAIKVKNSGVTELKACARNAGVTSTTLCVNIPNDNGWRHISIPFIMTATSNGIALTSTGTSGTVYVDDGFVGTSAPFQDVSGAKLVGTCKVTLSGSQFHSAGSFSVFSAVPSATYSVTGEAQQPSTNITGCKFASLPAGDYVVQWDGEFGNSTSGQRSIFSMYDGVSVSSDQDGCIGNAGYGCNTLSSRFSYSTLRTNVTFEPVARITSSGGNIIVHLVPQTLKVYYFPPATKIYSQASQDYNWTAYTPTSPNNSWTSLSSTECYHKREGSDLIVQCKFIGNSPQATEARISLPTGLTSANTDKIPSIRKVGSGTFSSVAGGNTHILIEPNVTYFTFGYETGSAGGLTKSTASNLASSGANTSFEARIPIQGWSDYGVIVGSFAGIEKCANDYECTDTFSAQVSATGVVSNENLDWINGNCTVATGVYTCPLQSYLKDGVNGLSSTLNCVASAIGTTRIMHYTLGSSTTSQIVFTETDPSVAKNDIGFSIKCQKGSQDYKPKTAKVASSIGVPTVPGITTQAIDTFSFSYGTTNATTVCSASPCSYLNQIGNAVSSVTRSTTASYVANFNKLYSQIKCTIQPVNANGNVGVTSSARLACENCSTLPFSTGLAGTGGQDTYGTLVCQGSY